MKQYTITGKEILIVIIIALAAGGYFGYSITSSHYEAEQAEASQQDSTAICRLELRDGGGKYDGKRYAALFEYRANNRDFCEKHVPFKYLPEDTDGLSFDSLLSEDDYDIQD